MNITRKLPSRIISVTMIVIVAAVAILTLLPARFAYAEFVNDADINALDAVVGATNNYVDAVNVVTDISDTAAVGKVISSGQTLQTKVAELNSHEFVTGINNSYVDKANILKQDATKIAQDVSSLDGYFQAQDTNSLNAALDTFNTDYKTFNADYDSFNSVIDTYNKPIQESNNTTATFYIIVLVISASVSVWSFVWAAKSKDVNERKLRLDIAKLSLWPSLGAVITTVWFFASMNSGGTYYIFWGPILFGAVAYAKAFSEYSTAKKSGAKASTN